MCARSRVNACVCYHAHYILPFSLKPLLDMEKCDSKQCCHIHPHISLKNFHKVTATCQQIPCCSITTTGSGHHLLYVDGSCLQFHWLPQGVSVATCRAQTSTTWAIAGELRMADVFWMGLRKLSLLIITSLYTPHRRAHIIHPVWLLEKGSPAMADKMNKSADQEEGKKRGWPGRFAWASHSVII